MAEIPKNVKSVVSKLKKNGFQAYLVGGCVRDLILGLEPKDWDVVSDADPEKVKNLFPESFLNNDFGTVNVKGIEITPFRTEEKYTDKRHPDKVEWAESIDQDLARRDFTVNAMAVDISESKKREAKKSFFKIIDLFGGQKDLKNKIIRAVGKPEDRFSEDALRMMRAVRFAVVMDFNVEKDTFSAIKKNSPWIQAISKERIRDELLKIIMAEKAAKGIDLLREAELLKYIIPELLEGYRVPQAKHHTLDCYEHYLGSLDYAAKKNFNKYVRIASLLHDIGKPRAKRGEGQKATFYNHEIIGAKITARVLNRLKFSKKDIEKIVKLVRYHLFYYNVNEVTEASVRKLVRNVGSENIEDLLKVRMSDRIGSGCPKAEPYKLRHLRYVIEKVSKDPISFKKMKVSGDNIMKILGIKPGPKIGWILDVLFGYILEDPGKNKKEFLEKEIKKLGKLSDKELARLSVLARKEREKIEMKKDEMTKQKYWVT